MEKQKGFPGRQTSNERCSEELENAGIVDAIELFNLLHSDRWQLNDYQGYLNQLAAWNRQVEQIPGEEPPLPYPKWKKSVRTWRKHFGSFLSIPVSYESQYRNQFLMKYESLVKELTERFIP